ncbi:gamma carbonic anhydrase family protein [Sphingopyxis kveilinensis]|uniref:gamma carbonic anhydrase family protein n=1 Tax=Sphingopyxis kveilinensis TaxID=3114367 RepID=UPI0030CA67B1
MPYYSLDERSPVIADGAWIAPSADLIGEVRLQADASVWFGATIRADNTAITLGARSNVQEGATLHSDPGAPLTIGEGVTIGHRAICHGCTIGNNVLIGMGAIVLNHAVIGDNCLVGAGALITEGKIFPAGSLIVGSPAKAVRELSLELIASLRASADDYVAKARSYARGLDVAQSSSAD